MGRGGVATKAARVSIFKKGKSMTREGMGGNIHCLQVGDVDCGIRHTLAGREQGAATLSGQ